MLSYGATGVWVGTRFICAEEAGASKKHQEAVMTAGYSDTIRTTICKFALLPSRRTHSQKAISDLVVHPSCTLDTGRPLRVRKTPFIMDWETNRREEKEELQAGGTVAVGMEPDDPSQWVVLQTCPSVL
jgi:hypothetical protein